MESLPGGQFFQKRSRWRVVIHELCVLRKKFRPRHTAFRASTVYDVVRLGASILPMLSDCAGAFALSDEARLLPGSVAPSAHAGKRHGFKIFREATSTARRTRRAWQSAICVFSNGFRYHKVVSFGGAFRRRMPSLERYRRRIVGAVTLGLDWVVLVRASRRPRWRASAKVRKASAVWEKASCFGFSRMVEAEGCTSRE